MNKFISQAIINSNKAIIQTVTSYSYIKHKYGEGSLNTVIIKR